MRRLLSLDCVLDHLDLAWLPTEPEKVAYFRRLGVPASALPRREYRGPFSGRSTRRYFAFKLPVAGDGRTTTFVYAETGGRHRLLRERIRAWADPHGALWHALRDRGSAVHIVVVTRTSADAAANAAVLDLWRGEPAPPLPSRRRTGNSSKQSSAPAPPATSLRWPRTAARSRRRRPRANSRNA